MTSQFVPTVTNMVTIVRNIIEGYGMGSLRALAQEPVQNSKDAAPRGRARVEYRLHRRQSGDGTDVYMLTVTDSNTTGLRGPIRSLADLAQGRALSEGENWAAFEGMGYTKKSSEDALGSRGQGKAAYLYHSNLPHLASGQERMMMLYDTLLPSGDYRLGVRYANPSDAVRQPPFTGDEACNIVSTRYADEGTAIELGLEALTQVGTRVIVPHLSQEAVDAVHSGELYQWLQRCWWRAIQTGLSIEVIDEDASRESVAVPPWWATEPWTRETNGVRTYENIDAGDGLKIKRVVLLYDESLNGSDAQFWGVQLLRGQQWIETLGQETLADYVPRDKRPGFRGFVEFDRGAERELRRAENPQHEHFDRRVSGVKELIAAIEDKVREFAEEQGWGERESTRPVPEGEREAALEFLRFLSPRRRSERGIGSGAANTSQLSMDLTERWECDLLMDFPDPRSSRVNWGEHIRNVSAPVRLQPTSTSRQATVSLELAHIDDRASQVVISSQSVHLQHGEGIARFGDFQIITGSPSPSKLQCTQSGKWRLTARVEAGGAQVARVSRSMFINEDPPERQSKPYTLSISVENHTTGQRRINSGDAIGVQISVTNHTADNQTLHLTASLGDLLLADMTAMSTQGIPAGATPARIPGVQSRIVVNPAAPPAPPQQSVELPPGRHVLRADLYLNGEVVAHASHTLDIEVDPAQPQDWPPFGIEQISGGGPHPRWQFHKRSPGDWVLQYPPAYPLYRALQASPSQAGLQLMGVSAFVVDVCAEGIIEWSMEPLDNGDYSRLDELLNGVPAGADPERWEDYCDKMNELAALRNRPERLDEYSLLVRDCASRSLSLFVERG